MFVFLPISNDKSLLSVIMCKNHRNRRDIEWYFVFVVPACQPRLGFKSTAWVNYKFRLEIITPDVYRRCTLAGQQRNEIFISAIKNHHLISDLPASKYTSITTTSLVAPQALYTDHIHIWTGLQTLYKDHI